MRGTVNVLKLVLCFIVSFITFEFDKRSPISYLLNWTWMMGNRNYFWPTMQGPRASLAGEAFANPNPNHTMCG